MATPKNDLQVYRGEDRVFRFISVKARSVAGWTTLMTVRTAFGSGGSTLFTKAGTINSAPLGRFDVTLTPTETTQTPGEYVYDFWRTDAGAERLLSTGTFEIAAEARI